MQVDRFIRLEKWCEVVVFNVLGLVWCALAFGVAWVASNDLGYVEGEAAGIGVVVAVLAACLTDRVPKGMALSVYSRAFNDPFAASPAGSRVAMLGMPWALWAVAIGVFLPIFNWIDGEPVRNSPACRAFAVAAAVNLAFFVLTIPVPSSGMPDVRRRFDSTHADPAATDECDVDIWDCGPPNR